jgi:penicillin-binding protein 1A
MGQALKGVAVQELLPPEGVILESGDWRDPEFARGAGVTSQGLEDVIPSPPTTEERSTILDLFRR